MQINTDIRERIYENAKALAKIRGLKLSDVEEKLGLSQGYLSRTAHGIKIEKVYELSKIFGVTIADLIEKDFWEEYKEKIAEYELADAIRKAKKNMPWFDIQQTVNRVLEENVTL